MASKPGAVNRLGPQSTLTPHTGNTMSTHLKRLLIYTAIITLIATGYAGYMLLTHNMTPEQETRLSEIGEIIGETALWLFVFIYLRTVLKLIMGKGPIARRLLPQYTPPAQAGHLQHLLVYLDRSHTYVGIAAVALVLLHIGLMGLHAHIWLFPIVLALVLWQAGFGLFLNWKQAPRDLKRLSFQVHAQLITGIAIGIFAYFGHLLIGD